VTKTIPWYVWLIPIAVLLVATTRMPYGYYTFTRIVVCGAAIWFAWLGWNEGQVGKALSVLLVLVAVLFNPVIPVHLNRGVWFYLGMLAAAVFAAQLVFVRFRRGIEHDHL
jgi:uncharacterized protein (DUF3820 family)